MPRAFTPKVITANHLIEGDAIWMRADGSWSIDPREAVLISEEGDVEAQMLRARERPDIAVDPYLADAKSGASGPEPTHFRETFRQTGPSNYAHGKQVELKNV